jgi:hypothetical protein
VTPHPRLVAWSEKSGGCAARTPARRSLWASRSGGRKYLLLGEGGQAISRQGATLASLILFACGGQESLGGLTGVVPVRIDFQDSRTEYNQAAIVAFVDGLATSGFFAGLAPRHLYPRFVVTDSKDALVRVVFRNASSTPGADPFPIAYHEGDRNLNLVTITVLHDASPGWPDAAYVLAHELVEAAADPWTADPDAEVADACVFAGYALAFIGGAEVRVPRHRSALTQDLCECWPCDGKIPYPGSVVSSH